MKNFEKEARDQLDQYKSSLEVKPLWDKINQELRPGKKKPTLFWWPLGISLLGISLFILTNSISESFKNTIKENIVENSINSKNTRSLDQSKSQLINNSLNTFNKISNKNTYIGTASLKAATFSNSNIYKKYARTKTLLGTKLPANIMKSNNAKNGNSIKNTSLIDLNSYPIIKQNLSNTLYYNSTKTLIINKNANSKASYINTRLCLAKYKSSVPQITGVKALNSYNNKNRFSLYLSLYGGYGLPYRSLSAKDSNNKYYEDSRTASETTLEVLQFGVLLGSKTYSGLFVESGFEFFRINERFDWNKSVIDTIGKYVIIGYILNAPEDTLFLSDSINILRVTHFNKKIFNSYSFYSIPITVGYEFNKNSRTRFYAKAGVLVNLRLENKVSMLNEFGLPTDYNTEPNTHFKSKIDITPFISAGIKYSFNNSVELYGELNYKHLNDISENSYLIKQSYNLISANIGLQFNF